MLEKRITVFMFMLLLPFGLITGRLFSLQVLQSYGGYAESNLVDRAVKMRSQTLAAEEHYRGEILDRKMRSLTDSRIRPTLVAFPGSMADVPAACRELAAIVAVPPEKLAVAIQRSTETYGRREPVILKVNLTAEEVGRIKQKKIRGTAVVPVKTRYGENSLARHLVGYVNSISPEVWQKFSREKKTADTNNYLPTAYRITDKIGVAGLEGKYEEVLRGSRPENNIRGIADGQGRLLDGLGYKISRQEADRWRNHLVLTIDRDYQAIVEKIMDEEIARGAVAVIDIPSGDVLAIASRPNFDQNLIEKYLSGYDELLDRSERVAFYPGSVFKVVVAAGVLEENLKGEPLSCAGKYVFPDETQINCTREHGALDLKEALVKSCNTAFVELGLRLGREKLTRYANKLGLKVALGADSPPALLANASIGQQGVLVSPLQIANLYATIGRNGVYRPYRLVAQIRNYQGEVIQDFPVKYGEQVLLPSTCAYLKECLTAATREGTGRQAWLEGKGAAGKTGTAQVNQAGRVIAWYAGFTPVENPRLAIAVMVEEKKSGASKGLRGGEEAAPVFRTIAEEIFRLSD